MFPQIHYVYSVICCIMPELGTWCTWVEKSKTKDAAKHNSQQAGRTLKITRDACQQVERKASLSATKWHPYQDPEKTGR
jgi:hypothetical protein